MNQGTVIVDSNWREKVSIKAFYDNFKIIEEKIDIEDTSKIVMRLESKLFRKRGNYKIFYHPPKNGDKSTRKFTVEKIDG